MILTDPRTRQLRLLVLPALLLTACPASETPPRRSTPGGTTAANRTDARRRATPPPRDRAATGPIRSLVEVEGNRFGVGLCVLRTRSARCGAVVSADPNHPPTFKVIPRPVKRISRVLTIAPGGDHRCELRSDATVWCRGKNSRGQLGLGHTRASRRPARVPRLTGVVSLATSWRTSCAALRDGSAWCWGEAAQGQAGDGGRVCGEDDDGCSTGRLRTSPHRVVGLTRVRRIYAAYGFACAVTRKGKLWCWGANDTGQLGSGDKRSSSRPRRLRSLSSVRAVALGVSRSCAATSTGALYCWPAPAKGRRRLRARRVQGLKGVTAVATGTDHVCAIAHGGQVWCWGANKHGQLGDGTRTSRTRPVRARGVTGATTLLGLTASTCAATRSGALYCWGAMGKRTANKREEILVPRKVRLIGQ